MKDSPEERKGILGIDVGKISYAALLDSERISFAGRLEEIWEDLKRGRVRVDFAGIDAPLTMPEKGNFRECEKELIKRGIRIMPFFFLKKIHTIAKKIKFELEKQEIKVFEVYPYATRKILNLSPEVNKRRDYKKIFQNLTKFCKIDREKVKNHHLVDAIICALTVKLFLKGQGEVISGKDGDILIPRAFV